MSTLSCPIVRLDAIHPHPNADRLELTLVKGWQAVVQKGLHQAGDLAVYVPTDAVVPAEVLDAFGYTGKLGGPGHDRVRTVKLRGEVSQGLVLPLTEVRKYLTRSGPLQQLLAPGIDLAVPLGITKYEPEVPLHMNGVVVGAPDWFRVFYDVENIKNWPGVFELDEEVIITEKIHGTNMRVGLHASDGFFVASRRKDFALVQDPTNLYWKAAQDYDLESRLRSIVSGGFEWAVLFGEVFGTGVQDLQYGGGDLQYRAFDLLVKTLDGEPSWITAGFLAAQLEAAGIPAVPPLYDGPFSQAVLDEHTNGPDFSGSHMREGVVVRPFFNREHPNLGRVMLKNINVDYELRKNATEYH